MTNIARTGDELLLLSPLNRKGEFYILYTHYARHIYLGAEEKK